MQNETLFLRRNLAQKNQQELTSQTGLLSTVYPPRKNRYRI